MIERIIGKKENENVGRVKKIEGKLKRKDEEIVGERMKKKGKIIERLKDIVEVKDEEVEKWEGERKVNKDGVKEIEKIEEGEIGGGKIVMKGKGGKRKENERGNVD